MPIGAAQRAVSARDMAHAAALFSSGRFTEAESRFSQLNSAQPGQFEILSRLGHLALLSNRLEQAIDFLAQALHINSRSRGTWGLLADAYYRKGELGSAAYCYSRLHRSELAGTLAAMSGLTPYIVQGDAGALVLPWTVSEPLPVISARINGCPANLVIDTGAGELVLDEQFAISADVPLGGRESRRFAGGREAAVWYGHAGTLELEEMALLHLPVQALPLEPIFGPFFPSLPIHGILGPAVLSQFVATLDYGAQALRLEPRAGQDRPSPEETAIPASGGTPFWIAGSHYPVAAGALPGSPYCLLFLDTGMAGTAFALPCSTADAANLACSSEGTWTGQGGGGEVQGRSATLSGLSLGQTRRSKLHGVVLEAFPLEVQFGFRIGGLLAQDFFKDCALTLDFGTMRMSLQCGEHD